jgi:hypothetical protein
MPGNWQSLIACRRLLQLYRMTSNPSLQQVQHFLIRGLGKGIIVPAHGIKFWIDEQNAHVIGDAAKALNGVGGSNRRSDDNTASAFPLNRFYRGFRSRAGSQAVVYK